MDPLEELSRIQEHLREALRAARDVASRAPPADVTDRLNGAAQDLDGLRGVTPDYPMAFEDVVPNAPIEPGTFSLDR